MAILDQKNDNKYVQAARNANSVYAKNPIQYMLCLTQYFELYKEMRYIRKEKIEFDIPVWVVHSEQDEIVSVKSLRKLSSFVGVQPVVAGCSGHYFYPPEARIEIINQLLTMLKTKREK